jgi:hypothetical protein
MKKVNIIYWIFTVLLILLMATSAIGSFMPASAESQAMMAKLGYMPYIIKFLAVLKILGIVALLVPGFPKIKEWAYAGFTFDLSGAIFSFIATGFPFSAWAPMVLGLVFIAGSYIYWHKKLKLQGLGS